MTIEKEGPGVVPGPKDNEDQQSTDEFTVAEGGGKASSSSDDLARIAAQLAADVEAEQAAAADPLLEAEATKTGNKRLDAALELAELGFAVLPINSKTRVPLHILPPTAEGGGVYAATNDKTELVRCWKERPSAGLAMRCNKVHVLDLDNKRGKEGTALVPNWQDLSPAIVRTPNDGYHLFFAADPTLDTYDNFNGIELWCGDRWTFMPPSPGYTWFKGGPEDLLRLPPLPLNLRPKPRERAYGDYGSDTEKLAVCLEDVAIALALIPHDNESRQWRINVGCAVYNATNKNDEWREKGYRFWVHWLQKYEAYHRELSPNVGDGRGQAAAA